MRSEVAWAAVSRRAAALFGLADDLDEAAREADGAPLGCEALRDFSSRVQVITSARQSEFFGADADAAEAEADADADADGGLPAGEFVPFNAAGLQCALAEACLFGWHVWGAESAACEAVGDAADALMAPPAATAA